MKTKEEIIGDMRVVGGIAIRISDALKAMEEYAQEHAKALMEWSSENDIYEGDDFDATLKRFKEFLKK